MKLNFKKVIAGFGLLMLAVSVNASDVTIPNTFSNGQVADANDVNANFIKSQWGFKYSDIIKMMALNRLVGQH